VAFNPKHTIVIANPNAAGGRVGRRWNNIEKQLRAHLGAISFQKTQYPGHGVALAKEAISQGYHTLLSMGGDGTHNEIVNGMMETEPEPGVLTLGILPAGTGGDFRRLLKNGATIESAAKALPDADSKPIDVGLVRFKTSQGVAKEGYFLNISSFGVSGDVVSLVNSSRKLLGGKATFYLATLRALIGYQAPTVRLQLDEEFIGEYPVTNVLVCNGQFAGGGMHFAPTARLSDGLFDVVVIKSQTLLRTVSLSGKIYKGTHIHEEDVLTFRGSSLRADITAMQSSLLDVDGEQPGILPAEFIVCPKAINLLDGRPDVL